MESRAKIFQSNSCWQQNNNRLPPTFIHRVRSSRFSWGRNRAHVDDFLSLPMSATAVVDSSGEYSFAFGFWEIRSRMCCLIIFFSRSRKTVESAKQKIACSGLWQILTMFWSAIFQWLYFDLLFYNFQNWRRFLERRTCFSTPNVTALSNVIIFSNTPMTICFWLTFSVQPHARFPVIFFYLPPLKIEF